MHIRYTSNSKFGAVLMTTSPVRLRAYNDEAVVASWLSRNKSKLYQRYGPELKSYGLWIITRTYTTQRASINAWMDKDKESVVSLKAKAAMLGELGEDLDWKDKALSKDWTTYQAKTDHGVVVFLDGIEVGPVDWWLEGIRYQMRVSGSKRERHLSEYLPDPISHQASAPIHRLGSQKGVLKKSPQSPPMLFGSESQSRRGSRLLGAGLRRKSEPSTHPIPQDLDPNANRMSQSYSHDAPQVLPGYENGHQQSFQSPQQVAPIFPQAPSYSAHRSPQDLGRDPSQFDQAAQQPTHSPSQPSYPNSHRISEGSAPRKVSRSSSPSRLHDSGYISHEPFQPRPREHSAALSLPPIQRIRDPSNEQRPTTLVADEAILYDAGMSSVSRSQSLRRVSLSSSIRTPSAPQSLRTQSLRKESRSILEDKAVESQLDGPNNDQAFDFFTKDTNHEMQGMMPPHMGLPPELRGGV
jgi:hypothetical protein